MTTSRRRYEVLGTVGEGGMGSVYHARLRGAGAFEKEVALKILHEEGLADAEDMAARLRDEARILGMIRHRAVVAVDGLVALTLSTEDSDPDRPRPADRWAVVMEFIDGVDLLEIREHHGPIPVGAALEVVAEVAGALHVAYHTEGPDGRPLKLLHRDIKPGNIRVTTTGDVKVLDFGVAKGDFDGREAQTRQVAFGSLGYVPQERVDGIDTPRGDVYGLGVVLFEMLAGERYGQTQLSRGRHDRRLAERIAVLTEAGIHRHVVELIVDMMGFGPEDRPMSRDVERRATDLRGALAGVRLRDWAEAHALDVMDAARNTLPDHGLMGVTFVEASSDPGPPERVAVPPPSGRRGWVLVVGIGLVLAAVMAIGAVMAVGLGVILGQAF